VADVPAELLRLIARRVSPAGSILCFHSITGADLPSASSTHVPLSTLTSAVAAARRCGEIVPLSEMVARHQAGRSTAGLIAITFDDAYAALLGSTAVFLREEAIPVCVFVATDAALSGSRFWWDRLDDSYPRVSPERWRAFERDCGLPHTYRTGQPREFGPLRPFRQWLLREFQGRWPTTFEERLGALEREAGTETAHRSMTLDELADLRAQAPVAVGIHTMSHPVLPLLGDDELLREVAESHHILRERFESVIPVLAVPFGLYDQRTLRLARSAGMSASLSLAGTTLRQVSPGDELPRFCLMREEPSWKLHLRILGIGDRLQRVRGNQAPRYPVLPSATT
jgi:peptidoglycan/xylan/chitin deacetylase (PgdA/CDA1 family)